MHNCSLLASLRHRLLMPILLFTIAILSSCGKEKTPEPEVQPIVETSALSFINPVSLELIGKVTNPGNAKVDDHGFVYWFNAEDEIAKGTKISLGSGVIAGFFTSSLNNLKFPESQGVPALFVMKAYITDKTGTHYGNIFSKRFDSGIVSSFSPNEGKSGDLITISGFFKGLKTTDFKVTLNTDDIAIKAVTDKDIEVEIPTNLPIEHGQKIDLKIQVAGVTYHLSNDFKILANIKDINPKSGILGTRILLIGDNLPKSNAIPFSVGFGTNLASLDYDNGIHAQLATDTKSEKVNVFYNTDKGTINFPLEFSITPFSIKSIHPNPALPNQEITITIDDFIFREIGDNAFVVSAGRIPLTVNASREGHLVFRLDQLGNFVAGNSYPVTLSYGPHTVKAAEPLHIIKPEATGFYPKKGAPGTAIHIIGKFAKGTGYPVSFGNDPESTYFTAISDSELVGYISMGRAAKTSSLLIKGDGTNINVPGGSFEVLPSKFASLSSSSGPGGKTINIIGEGFYNDGGELLNMTVRFGNATGSISGTNISNNRMVLQLPTGTLPGTYKLKLEWHSKEAGYDLRTIDTGLSYTITN